MTEAPPIDWTDLEQTQPAPGHDPRQPPHDLDAEQAVLGACMLNPHVIPEVDAILGPDDFYRPHHQTIWHALVDLAGEGTDPDPVTVHQHLQHDRTYLLTGGATYLHTLISGVPTVSNATHYARIVTEHARSRAYTELATWLDQAARGAADDEQIRNRLAKTLEERKVGAPAAHTSWAALDLTDALAGDTDSDQPTLMPRTDGPCLLYAGAVHMLSGEPTAGKTWIALHETARLLNAGQPVAYIDFEDREHRVVARLLALGARPDQIREHLRYARPHDALDTAGRADLAPLVTGAALAVIDGVTEAMTLHGLDLSSNPDVATFYALLPRWVANHGPTVVLIDHVVKDGERQGRWSIGGQHKVAGIDGAAYTVKNVVPFGRGKAGHSRLFIAKDRHGHVEEHALGRCAAEFHLDSTDPAISRASLEAPEAMPTTETGEGRPTFLMERVSRYVEINPGETSNGIVSAKLGKAQYVREAIAALVTEGYIEVRPGARNATHHHSIEPFRRAEGDPDADA